MAWVPIAAAAVSAAGKAATPGSAAPSSSDQMASVGIDFSNWTVSTGNSKADGATTATGLNLPPWLIFGAVGLIAVAWIRTRKA